MKRLELTPLLRTSVFTRLLTAIMGVSACSNSEKQNDNTQSGEAMGANQDVKEYAKSDAPTSAADTNVGAGQVASTSTNNDMNTTGQSGSSDNMGNNEPDNNTDGNPNSDKTPAEGLQQQWNRAKTGKLTKQLSSLQ